MTFGPLIPKWPLYVSPMLRKVLATTNNLFPFLGWQWSNKTSSRELHSLRAGFDKFIENFLLVVLGYTHHDFCDVEYTQTATLKRNQDRSILTPWPHTGRPCAAAPRFTPSALRCSIHS